MIAPFSYIPSRRRPKKSSASAAIPIRTVSNPAAPSSQSGSPPAKVPRPLKTTPYRGISRIWLGLRVGNYATEVLFQALVSEAIFWCLVLPDPLSVLVSSKRPRADRLGGGPALLRRIGASRPNHQRPSERGRSNGGSERALIGKR